MEKLPENSQPRYVPPAEDSWQIFAIATASNRVMLPGLLYTAGRRSEQLRWTWEDDIALNARRIRLSTCKISHGNRKHKWMTMPLRLYGALVAPKVASDGHGHVFTSKRAGEPYKCRKRFIIRLCLKANVRQFNFHGIRGLTATLLADGGVPMKEIQHVLLHASMTTTDRSIRRIDGANDMLAAAFDWFEEKKKAGKVVPFSACM